MIIHEPSFRAYSFVPMSTSDFNNCPIVEEIKDKKLALGTQDSGVAKKFASRTHMDDAVNISWTTRTLPKSASCLRVASH